MKKTEEFDSIELQESEVSYDANTAQENALGSIVHIVCRCLSILRKTIDKSVDHYNRGTNQNIRNIRYACIGNRLLK